MRLSAYHIEANKLRTTKILAAKIESPTVKTFTFKDKQCAKAKPGQFLMLWIPGVDEIPLSILDANENGDFMVAVKKVGEATRALHSMRVGDIVGVRGPFGNSFTMKADRVLLVGGGTGIAPLFFLTKKIGAKASRLVFVLGAKTKEELLFIDELQDLLGKKRAELVSTTEDGSCGITGLCTEPLESLLAKEKFDIAYACGPELMVRRVFDLTERHGTYFEASLERLMRCAIGLCGSCVIGKYRVCKDGPIFTAKQLDQIRQEFGVSKRDFNGKKIRL